MKPLSSAAARESESAIVHYDKSGHSALTHAAHDEAMRDVLSDAHVERVERAHAEWLARTGPDTEAAPT